MERYSIKQGELFKIGDTFEYPDMQCRVFILG